MDAPVSPVPHTLRGAATYIETYGWEQGCMFTPGTNPFRSACALAAIVVSATGHSSAAIDQLSEQDSGALFHTDDYENAVMELADYLTQYEPLVDPDGTGEVFFADLDEAAEIVWHVNDNSAMTADYMCRLLRDAATWYERQSTNTH